MSAATSVFSGLSGALMLARGRPEGIHRVPADMAGAARSFWAAAIAAPMFLVLVVLGVLQGGTAATWSGLGRVISLNLLAYVIGWAGYALLSRPVLRVFGRLQRWPRFIAIWNWCNVVQYALLLAATLPAVAGAPALLSETVALVGQGWALWLEWYAIRLALEVTGLEAAAVMAPDVLLGVGLAVVVALLAGG